MEWISVRDRLPEAGQDVIIYGECCHMCWNINIAWHENGEWVKQDLENPHHDVTHWMPLPAPPAKPQSSETDYVQLSKSHAGQPENK